MTRFAPETLIKDVIAAHPDAAAVFESFGLGCASCLAAGMDSVASAAAVHDVSVQDLLAQLNALDDVEPSGRDS